MDPKYANLPGIASNEPDVYETVDVPEVDQKIFEDDSNNVPKIFVSTKEAFDKYNKTDFSGKGVDFSNSFKSRRVPGYSAENLEWDPSISESPLQRFKRLEREMDELKADLKQFSTTNSEPGSETATTQPDFDPQSVLIQVEALQKQAASLHLESIGAKVNQIKFGSSAKKQFLIDQLNEAKKTMPGKEVRKQHAEGDVPITFKIFNDVDSTSIEKASKLSDLGQRVAKLELLLGSNTSAKATSALFANIDNKSLLGIVENLNNKVSLVELPSIELIESRLQHITQKVNQLSEKRQSIEDHEKMSKISELYTMISKWQDVSATLPNVIARLTALSDLHQQAYQFASALNRLDSEQDGMKKILDTNSDALKQLKGNLESNLESIKSNFDNLNTRLLNLSSSKA